MHLVTNAGHLIDYIVGFCRHSSDCIGSSEIEEARSENFEEEVVIG